MSTSKITAALGILAVLILPSWVEAAVGTVDIDHATLGASDFLGVYGGGHNGTEIFAGAYKLDKTGGTGMGTIWPNGLLPAFCIELNEYAPILPVTFDVIEPEDATNSILGDTFGTTRASYLQELWGRYYDPSWAGSGPFTSSQIVEATAFGAAVWEIVYEDLPVSPLLWNVDVDGSAGIAGLSLDGVNSVLANSWLHSLNGSGPKTTLAVLTNEGCQNYLVAVPEPATLVLLGLGGAFSLARHRRRLRA